MPYYKITKKYVATVRSGQGYSTGHTIEMSKKEAKERKAELGLVPITSDDTDAEDGSNATETSKASAAPGKTTSTDDDDEFGLASAAAEVLDAGDYNKAVRFLSEVGVQLESRKKPYIFAQIKRLAGVD